MRYKSIFSALRYSVLLLAAASAANASASTNASPSVPTPPPSAPAQRSAADLEKLVAPVALYPDPLIAIVLPAAVYPLEIVQAARFVKNTNNIAKLDQQPWDDNVKAVARIPELISKLDSDIAWTSDLGQAFLNQPKEVMDTIQTLRLKAQQAGTLQSSPQQIVTVTNQVVEILPAQPQVVYVPTYDPVAVYYPTYGYVYNPVAPLVTFGVGMAVGAAIANNDCDWHGGGVYVGHHGVAAWGGGHHDDVDVDVNRKVNVENNGDVNINNNRQNVENRQNNQQKWQPDQSRLQKSGSAAATDYQSREARGWGGSANQANLSPTSRNASGARSQPRTTGTANSPAANRPATQPASRPATQPAANRPAAQPTAQNNSAFTGVNSGSQARDYSNRGATSRAGSGGGGGGARGGGGGGRGGGGRR
jgi:hypothetical protein